MDIKKFTTTLQGDFAGQAMAVIVEYCITQDKQEALKRFRSFSNSLFHAFTREEQEELAELVGRAMEKRAGKLATSLGKTLSNEQVNALVADQGTNLNAES